MWKIHTRKEKGEVQTEIGRRIFDRQRALAVNRYDKPLGHNEEKEENVSYSVYLEKYGSIPLKFHVKYKDGNIYETKPIPFLIWSVSWIWQSSTLPEE